MQFDIYQESVFDDFKNTQQNILVNSVAGSGKTTTILQCLNILEKSKTAKFLAFNKAISEELKRKTQNPNVSTMHSMGLQSLRKTFPHTKVSENKVKQIIYSLQKHFNVKSEDMGGFVYTVNILVDFARMYNVVLPNTTNITNLALSIGLMPNELEVNAAIKTLQMSNNSLSKEVDFIDMIYQPVKLNLLLTKYDVVFVDEAQDLNVIQQLLFQNAIKRTGRFVAVGDPYQSIYGFAGADAEAFDNLRQIPNTIEKPLNCCYRCSKTIIGLAQSIVPHIHGFEGSDSGIVVCEDYNSIIDGDMVLCRNNKPLVQLALKLFNENKKCTIKGRDFGNELIQLIQSTKHVNKTVSMGKLNHLLEVQVDKLKKLGVQKPESTNSYKKLLEKIDIITTVVYPKVSDTKQAVTMIDKLFRENNDSNRIMLSTIHKAKGLESDNVHILNRELLGCEDDSQEKNLEYVAYTRAKKKLNFLIQ